MPPHQNRHPMIESAFGVRVGDRVEKRISSFGKGFYGGGVVTEIRTGYVGQSGIRAHVDRRDDADYLAMKARYGNTPALAVWDLSTLAVVERAPGPRVDGLPDGVEPYQPPALPPDDVGRLEAEIAKLRERVALLERREERRRRREGRLVRTLGRMARDLAADLQDGT